MTDAEINTLEGVELACAVVEAQLADRSQYCRYETDTVVMWDKIAQPGSVNCGPVFCIDKTDHQVCDFDYRPNSDGNQALELLMLLGETHWWTLASQTGRFCVHFRAKDEMEFHTAFGSTVPEAICRAYLKAQLARQ